MSKLKNVENLTAFMPLLITEISVEIQTGGRIFEFYLIEIMQNSTCTPSSSYFKTLTSPTQTFPRISALHWVQLDHGQECTPWECQELQSWYHFRMKASNFRDFNDTNNNQMLCYPQCCYREMLITIYFWHKFITNVFTPIANYKLSTHRINWCKN